MRFDFCCDCDCDIEDSLQKKLFVLPFRWNHTYEKNEFETREVYKINIVTGTLAAFQKSSFADFEKRIAVSDRIQTALSRNV